MAVKIRLKRMGKKFQPFYRVVVLDGRKRRDGRVIEEIGIYDPMQEPSLIRIDSERAQYWLGVGAQPSDTVFNLLKITGIYQAFKGLKAPEGKLKVKEGDAAAAAEAAIKAAAADAEKRKAAASEAKAKAEKEAAEAAAAEAKAAEETASEEAAEAPAEEA
ncbi:30S ribosomal protein S16 [Actinomyces bovis]|uniref:Small ribosomal subunit protein bS16 n=1 Tax=Actinomyces bovis TaxID=1658 RepID=A0ABY1VKP3_9ACTO|nr:30S ribosomal protein S16 [Actinomyces bovis]SPT52660.1 30S ribosomal protein S16 [Actinomyces bovis]VEG54564.1 30S ribosomal protein S16 [Actinomyces israelii]